MASTKTKQPVVKGKGKNKSSLDVAAKGTHKKSSGADSLLMQEIMALGGSAEDMELLRGVEDDSDGESESALESATTEQGDGGAALQAELATFMKSLFGGGAVPSSKNGSNGSTSQSTTTVLEVDDDYEDEEAVDADSDEEWSTEESGDDNNAEEDSDDGNDSMDDLPPELKAISEALDSREKARKEEKTKASQGGKSTAKAGPSKPAVASTSASPSVTSSDKRKDGTGKAPPPPQESKKEVKGLKEQSLHQIKKDIIGQLKKNAVEKKEREKARKIEQEKAKRKHSGKEKKPAWKLGDGWSASFAEEEEDSQPATKKQKNATKTFQGSTKKKVNGLKNKSRT